ncbi:hypothetical protein COV82_04425 [Candidatus Peregrinibacteria bacterium CG11_big_fil_rev_8_21_14_0_20_46_8]|nr:MAG: hypothetical protein COV82_04425 [Candidatus Peregrinibacteria bacterium CG11_big_fil_rev_8_21_14_0_20_46_8]
MNVQKYIAGLMSIFVVAASILGGPLAGTAQDNDGPFIDVPKSSSFAVAVGYLKENNLVAGFSDGLFHPEREVSRAEALAMILAATAQPQTENQDTTQPAPQENTPADTTSPADSLTSFHNVTAENPVKIILPRKTEIIVQDLITGEERVLPDIRHIQIDGTATLELSAKLDEKPFTDVRSSDWFYETVQEAKSRGIVSGVGDGNYFKPHSPVTLAAGLRMLFKAADVTADLTTAEIPASIPADAWYAKDIAYALDRTILTSKNGIFSAPDRSLTRGELALLIYRYIKTNEGAEFGYASWYADGLAKTKLTKGLEFKERNLTAAHKTLPFGTIVRVTDMDNGEYVDVVINDRGPFVVGRIIDLSRSAFTTLEASTVGVVPVQMEVMDF